MLCRRMSRAANRSGPDTRRRIIVAARACFGRSGYDLTTNKDIAAEAEVTTGAIYHYFDSKPDLFVAVYDELTERMTVEFDAAASQQSTLAGQIRAILERAVDMNRADPSVGNFSVIAQTELHRHPELAELVVDASGVASLFARLVRSAHQRGELADDMDVNATVSMLVAVSMGLAQLGALVEHVDVQQGAVDAFLRAFEGSMFRAR
jgi:AcrR family transcriptional regulator